MASSTYLDITNKVLRRLKEEPLSSSNFANTTRSVHGLAKDAVNDAINEIYQEEVVWSFNYEENNQITMVVGQSQYDLETLLSKTIQKIDFDNIVLEGSTPLGVSTKTLLEIDHDEYKSRYRAKDLRLLAANYGVPDVAFRYPNKKLGISTRPDKLYTMLVNVWTIPVEELTTYTDTPTIPTRFDRVIVDGALKYLYMARQNAEAVAAQESLFLKGVRQMRTLDINEAYTTMSDSRSSAAVSSTYGGSRKYI